MIRLTPVRVIGPDGEPIGVLETPAAIRMAEERGMDLVEMVADSRPPVCKIMDYGKYKYELSKKESKNRAASKSQEMKEIRLGRSIKIDPHDVKIRVEQSRRFLMQGHKVQFTQRFRGREMMHRHLGITRLNGICEALSDIAKVDSPPRFFGKQAMIMLSPDKVKIEALKRKMKKEELEALEKEEEVLQEADANVVYDDDDDDDHGEGQEGHDGAAGNDHPDGSHESATPGAEAKPAPQPADADDKKKKKGPKDNRARNPIDDEVRALLGE
jgi:translation initiation factor IF-3